MAIDAPSSPPLSLPWPERLRHSAVILLVAGLALTVLVVLDELSVLRIAKKNIPLSSSATDPSVYPIVEKALGINLTKYALN